MYIILTDIQSLCDRVVYLSDVESLSGVDDNDSIAEWSVYFSIITEAITVTEHNYVVMQDCFIRNHSWNGIYTNRKLI